MMWEFKRLAGLVPWWYQGKVAFKLALFCNLHQHFGALKQVDAGEGPHRQRIVVPRADTIFWACTLMNAARLGGQLP